VNLWAEESRPPSVCAAPQWTTWSARNLSWHPWAWTWVRRDLAKDWSPSPSQVSSLIARGDPDHAPLRGGHSLGRAQRFLQEENLYQEDNEKLKEKIQNENSKFKIHFKNSNFKKIKNSQIKFKILEWKIFKNSIKVKRKNNLKMKKNLEL